MKILLVNDDGIHAPGLRALHDVLQELGDVKVVAPLVEQSGVGHRITYLHPIMVKEVIEEGEHFGWAVDGSPADCVKLGVLEFCNGEPDLIVSGINSGANVGINVLYSGTVAAAIEGAFFGITSIAVSLGQQTPPDYPAAAIRALHLIRQLLKQNPRKGMLWNINFPATRPEGPRGVKLTAMAVRRHTDTIEKRIDPRGRPYYWSGLDAIRNHELDDGTDVKEFLDGYVSITPLHFDLTEVPILKSLGNVEFTL
ncbi:5'/3'-nucleotidase SurE [Planctomicrobium piriforme]|uniref:5'-nucleotidase SurE n=1 Tax=Planctomicrobium piriforme TaxID=1576369 RepID=A0A1I3AV63_9PLAN|nr:5'/3'-nucleotidase SurE [Planctomicrobium piriforme]SFH53619.1 5'-nucleotidase [Planctomicrobium piriforme]